MIVVRFHYGVYEAVSFGDCVGDSRRREHWRTEEQRRNWWGQEQLRREEGESREEATVGGKDSAAREVGKKVMGIVVAYAQKWEGHVREIDVRTLRPPSNHGVPFCG